MRRQINELDVILFAYPHEFHADMAAVAVHNEDPWLVCWSLLWLCFQKEYRVQPANCNPVCCPPIL